MGKAFDFAASKPAPSHVPWLHSSKQDTALAHVYNNTQQQMEFTAKPQFDQTFRV